jgi:small subunit ribosomal protein S5
MDGLIRLRRPEEVAELRGLTISQVLGLSSEKGTGDGEHLSAEGEAAEAQADAPVAVAAEEAPPEAPAEETAS